MDLKRFKKAELHIHLDGSLRSKTVLDIAKEQSILLPTYDLAELGSYLSISNQMKHLSEYLQKFDIPIKILQTKKALKRASFEFVADAFKLGYIYSEVRFSPHLMVKGGLNMEDVVKSSLAGLKKGNEKYGIETNLILCILRHHSQEVGFETVELAKHYKTKGVVGIDLAGDEYNYSAKKFAKVFERAKRLGIPYTIHAGEAVGKESIWEAISFEPNRLGHGVRAFEDRKLLDKIRAENICLEFCPVSNFQTRVLADFADYPIKKFLDMGIKVSLNTDNRTVSDTNYEKEVELLRGYFEIDENELIQMNKNAIESAFVSPQHKATLLKRAEE